MRALPRDEAPEDFLEAGDLRAVDDFFLLEAFRAGAALRLVFAFEDFDDTLLRLEAPALRAFDAPAFFEPFLELFEAALFLEAAAEALAGRFAARFFAPPFLAAPFFAPPLLFLELDAFLVLLDFADFFAADFFAAIGVLLFQNLSDGEPYVFEIRDRAAWQLGCTKSM